MMRPYSMSDAPNYRDQLARTERMKTYAGTQERYLAKPRESDRILIEMLAEHGINGTSTVLDVACSTGNLLRHVLRRWPGIALTGRDLSKDAIEVARAVRELDGIRFEVADLLQNDDGAVFDVVIANAVLYQFHDAEYEQAVRRIGAMTKPGGLCLVFDWYHAWEQDLEILERTALDPDGMTIVCKSYRTASRIFRDAGFAELEFRPFSIPVDLPRPESMADNCSYTVRAESGERLTFRGGLFQPWCHVVARKL